jgi:hypothetical protein
MNRDPLFDDEVNILSFDRSSNLELGEDVEFTICIQSATGLPLDRFTDITCHLLFHDQSFLQTPVVRFIVHSLHYLFFCDGEQQLVDVILFHT